MLWICSNIWTKGLKLQEPMAKFNIYSVLLPDSMQCFCWDGWTTFALRELAVDTLTIAWRWASVSLVYLFFYSSQLYHFDIVFTFLTNIFFNWCMHQNILELPSSSFHFGFIWPQNTEGLFSFKGMFRVQIKLKQWHFFS